MKENSISVVIPILLNDKNKEKIMPLLSDCVQSLKGHDEIILQFDINGEGFAKTVNKGLKKAKGDYIAIVNDDIKMLQGSIKDMCHKNSLVRPKLIGGDLAKFAFVVIDKDILQTVGYLDEDFKVGFYEDDDYLDRCTELGVRLIDSPLQVWHYGGATMQDMKGDFEKYNKQLYENKRNLRIKKRRIN